jgi:hypothetical protein
MMKSALYLVVVALTGCATASKTYTENGDEGYTINCSGNALTWATCYEKAGKLCGSAGYNTISKDGDTGNTFSGNQFGLYGGSIINRSMVISCRK